MALLVIRIDDRLIHGQVAAVWCNALNIHRIVVVDDQVPQDPFLVDILKVAAPKGVAVEVCTVKDGPAVLEQDQEVRSMAIVKRPRTIVRLYEAGFTEKPPVSVGGMGSGPGRQMLWRNISVSPQDIEDLRQLVNRYQLDVKLQILPDEGGIPVVRYLEKNQVR
jgi:PTS system mannose-specific IIB component